MSKKFLIICCGIFLTIPLLTKTNDTDSPGPFDPDLVFDDDNIFNQIDTTNWEPNFKASCISVADVVDILTNPDSPIILQERLQQNLYLFTNPINHRSLLDLPQYLLHQWCLPEKKQFFWSLFYNQASKVNYTKNGSTVEAYLNLRDSNILQRLDELEFDIDIPAAIDLFSILKIQERRGGFMFGGYRVRGPWNIECKAPFYYLERNFFITEQERKAVQRFLNPQALPSEDDDGDSEKEIRKHLVSDKVGVGDTRFNVGRYVVQDSALSINVGGLVTIPTAFPFAQGLIGSHFEKNSDHPALNILELFQLGLCTPKDLDKIKALSTAFLVSSFDKLSANILDTSLGNNGHVGFGAFIEKHLKISSKFSFKTRVELEYLLPATEKRFYITKKFPEAFSDNFRHYQDPDLAVENLAFLNDQLIATLIPEVFKTTIYPGFIFKFDTALCGKIGRNWLVDIGFDLWWQDKEKLGTIDASPTTLFAIRPNIAIKPGAYQNKIFASVNYTKKRKDSDSDWCISFYGDTTFIQYGIGKDFNISLHVALNC